MFKNSNTRKLMTSGDINIILAREILLSESKRLLTHLLISARDSGLSIVPLRLWRPDLYTMNMIFF